MTTRRRYSGAVPTVACLAGAVLAHAIDYVVAFPDASERARHLHDTGHLHWPLAAAMAIGAAAFTVALAVGRGVLRAGRSSAVDHVEHGQWAGMRGLLAWQVVTFVAMEATERALVGSSLGGLLRSPEFWLGLALQVPVAWLLARFVAVLDRGAYRLVSVCRRPAPRPGRRLREPVFGFVRGGIVLPAAARCRAPPLLVRA